MNDTELILMHNFLIYIELVIFATFMIITCKKDAKNVYIWFIYLGFSKFYANKHFIIEYSRFLLSFKNGIDFQLQLMKVSSV